LYAFTDDYWVKIASQKSTTHKMNLKILKTNVTRR